MDNLENQIGAILGNPEMMEKIKSLAGAMSQGDSKQDTGGAVGDFDPGLLQKLSGLAGQSGIDKNQRTLLGALRPYVSQQRLSKLERAMRAAKMASMAGIFLGKSPSGR